MKARLEDKNRAIELRRQGLSYKEIQMVVPVSKGLLSGWFSTLKLTPIEEVNLKNKLKQRRDRGKMNSLISNKTRRIERERKVLKEAEELFTKYKKDIGFLTGVLLYWSQGARHTPSFQFTSSDYDMVSIMYGWIQRYLGVKKDNIRIRLITRPVSGSHHFHEFWAKNLDLKPDFVKKTILKSISSDAKRDPMYKGSLQFTLTKVRYMRLMLAWQRLFIEIYGKALLSHK